MGILPKTIALVLVAWYDTAVCLRRSSMPEVVVETWTSEDVVEALSAVARVRFDCSFDELVNMHKRGELDSCEHAEILALLNFLPTNEPVCAA
jgi:hypothetical protein